ncbi:TPA: acyltransferase, partial [Klebsiella quasipneumoniae subsp. quasipneumoniae]|nr:acyltransferase [Klebsiella quasipneumoniae subsp. quasipneumoniae]
YLYALAGYFFTVKILNKFKYITITLAVMLNYSSSLGFIEGWGVISIAQNMVFFVIGVYFSEIIVRWSEIKKDNILPWILILTLALLNIKLGIGKNVFVCVTAVIFSIIICRFMNDKFDMSWLNWIGKNTLQIYVIHRIYVEFFGLIFLHLGIEGGWFKNPAYSIAWGVTFPAIAVFIYATLSIFTWRLLNNGLGKALFSHPRLIKKNTQEISQ